MHKKLAIIKKSLCFIFFCDKITKRIFLLRGLCIINPRGWKAVDWIFVVETFDIIYPKRMRKIF